MMREFVRLAVLYYALGFAVWVFVMAYRWRRDVH